MNDYSPVKEFQTCLDYDKINKMAEKIVQRNTQYEEQATPQEVTPVDKIDDHVENL